MVRFRFGDRLRSLRLFVRRYGGGGLPRWSAVRFSDRWFAFCGLVCSAQFVSVGDAVWHGGGGRWWWWWFGWQLVVLCGGGGLPLRMVWWFRGLMVVRRCWWRYRFSFVWMRHVFVWWRLVGYRVIGWLVGGVGGFFGGGGLA